MDLSKMTSGEWVIVFATVMGPILAIQAQKFLEGLREYRNGKLWVFRTLMTTRHQQSRLSPDHVRALNMIDVSFYGNRFLFIRWQTKVEKKVATAWKAYLDNLSTDIYEWSESQKAFHLGERDRQFGVLIGAVAESVGYSFDEVHIKKVCIFRLPTTK
ncbi:MAG TPA: DUF6680 family protein [Polaromonas sp.]|jgi:hypothetical protein